MTFCGQSHESESLELFIETLTGTMFELKASPDDTILGIKYKLQSVEGIPVSEQHLLYKFKELNNSTSIGDCSIPNGATLKLVLSMRVGPLCSRRYHPIDEAAWRELQQLITDSRKEALPDKLPPGSKLTVFLFHDGDKINCVKILENEDGSYSPISDSCRGDPVRPVFAGLYPEESSKSPCDNSVALSKVLELKERLDALSLQAKDRKCNGSTGEQNTSVSHRKRDGGEERTRSVRVVTYVPSGKPNLSTSLKLVRKSPKNVQMSGTSFSRRPFPAFSEIAMISLSEGRKEADDKGQIQSKPRVSANSESSQSNGLKRPPLPEIRPTLPSNKEKIVPHDDKLDNSMREKTANNSTVVENENDVSPPPSICSSQNSIVALPSSEEVTAAATFSPTSKDNVSTTASRSTCKVSSYTAVNDERFKMTQSSLNGKKEAKPEQSKKGVNGKESSKPKRTNRILSKLSRIAPVTKVVNVVNGKEVEMNIEDFARRLAPTEILRRSTLPKPHTIPKLPTIPKLSSGNKFLKPGSNEQPEDKKRLRCSKCKKKLNITNTYKCRCGGIFCSVHRYSEVHVCLFDYKQEDRKNRL